MNNDNTSLVLTKEGIGNVLEMIENIVNDASVLYDLKLGITNGIKEVIEPGCIEKRVSKRKVISLYIDLE
ncbi:MAG: hypothetical protein KDH96_02825 [Candidatus Riesia sp.]|nr:hypothetical protein [Candidatus Riesia sp.]